MNYKARLLGRVLIGAGGALMLAGAAAQDRPSVNPPLVEAELQRSQSHDSSVRVQLPDLRTTRIKAETLYGGGHDEVEVQVDIVNDGAAPSAATELLVTVAVIDPRSGRKVYPQGSNTATSQFFRNPMTTLTVGQTKRFFGGYAVLPNRTQDWDLGIEASADSPVGRVNGNVPESNERNNSLYRTCRIYGSNPNPTGPQSCSR